MNDIFVLLFDNMLYSIQKSNKYEFNRICSSAFIYDPLCRIIAGEPKREGINNYRTIS